MKINFFPEHSDQDIGTKRKPLDSIVKVESSEEAAESNGVTVKFGDKEITNKYAKGIVMFFALLVVALVLVIVAALLPVFILVVSAVLLLLAAFCVILAPISPFLILFGIGKGGITLD
jgi:hypothetical protein